MSALDETEGLQAGDEPPAAVTAPPPRCSRRRLCFAALATALIGALVVVLLIVFATNPSELPPPCVAGCSNFSHAAWTGVLAAHLRPSSRSGVSYVGFDYEGLRADPSEFRKYLQQLAAADLRVLGSAERKALFINAYNALTVRKLLDECGSGLCGSILDLSGVVSVWGQPAGQVGGAGSDRLYSLDDIEHVVLRPTYNDARIHASVVCASVSCPDLAPAAFEVKTLDQQLDEQTGAWLANPSKGLSVDQSAAGNSMVLSKIFDWYSADFEAEPGGNLGFVARHAPSGVAAWLGGGASPSLSYFNYDWSVNSAS